MRHREMMQGLGRKISARCFAALCAFMSVWLAWSAFGQGSESIDQAVRSKDPTVAGPAAEQLLKAADRADPQKLEYAPKTQTLA
jgi:hypothetical protein